MFSDERSAAINAAISDDFIEAAEHIDLAVLHLAAAAEAMPAGEDATRGEALVTAAKELAGRARKEAGL